MQKKKEVFSRRFKGNGQREKYYFMLSSNLDLQLSKEAIAWCFLPGAENDEQQATTYTIEAAITDLEAQIIARPVHPLHVCRQRGTVRLVHSPLRHLICEIDLFKEVCGGGLCRHGKKHGYEKQRTMSVQPVAIQ